MTSTAGKSPGPVNYFPKGGGRRALKPGSNLDAFYSDHSLLRFLPLPAEKQKNSLESKMT